LASADIVSVEEEAAVAAAASFLGKGQFQPVASSAVVDVVAVAEVAAVPLGGSPDSDSVSPKAAA
jgi:hypothetical protein